METFVARNREKIHLDYLHSLAIYSPSYRRFQLDANFKFILSSFVPRKNLTGAIVLPFLQKTSKTDHLSD